MPDLGPNSYFFINLFKPFFAHGRDMNAILEKKSPPIALKQAKKCQDIYIRRTKSFFKAVIGDKWVNGITTLPSSFRKERQEILLE